MRPTVYYGNLLLSGTLSGSQASTTNPVRIVDDGSINVSYRVTSAQATQSGSVVVALTTSGAPVALSVPKCLIPSGYTLKLQSMSDPVTEAGLVTVVSATFVSDTVFFLRGISGAASALYWRFMLSGAAGLVSAKVHEIQLATTSAQLGTPQVGVDRQHVRQYARVAIPGGQPFVRRDGPKLNQSTYIFVAVSGAGLTTSGLADEGTLETFIDAVAGGSAFTLTDDLARSYWAELLGEEIGVHEDAGVTTWNLVFQEIKVD